MTELKPCPFCPDGGRPKVVYLPSPSGDYWKSTCQSCLTSTRLFMRRKEAIAAWNTRAERTCRQVITECNDGLMPPFTANCSECGIAWGYTPSYCPECHAKVIGD